MRTRTWSRRWPAPTSTGTRARRRYGERLTPYLKTAATAKHFALNNVEATRQNGSSDTTEANIRNYYTPQFRSLVQDAHVAGLMTAYNRVNGTPAAADTYLANLARRAHLGLRRLHHLGLRRDRRHLAARPAQLGAAGLDHRHRGRPDRLDRDRDRQTALRRAPARRPGRCGPEPS